MIRIINSIYLPFSILHMVYYDLLRLGKKPPVHIISVGSIFAGGTGKTPLTEWLVRFFAQQRKKVVLLSRGYGRKTGRIVFLKEDSDFKYVGDEPLMFRKRNPQIPAIIGRDRVKTAFLGFETFKPDVIVLDDGFQHRRLKRDVDIVTVPFVEESESIWKREPVSSMKRADAVVIKGGWEEAKKWQKFNLNVIAGFSYKPSCIYSMQENKAYPVDFIKGKDTVIFSGIALPKNFEDIVLQNGARIVRTFRFPDHYVYTDADIRKIQQELRREEIMLTTEKDSVRLPNVEGLPVFCFCVEIFWTFGREKLIEILS
jgi:tetraacyldisaccharide 4'-kinase